MRGNVHGMNSSSEKSALLSNYYLHLVYHSLEIHKSVAAISYSGTSKKKRRIRANRLVNFVAYWQRE